MTSEKLKYLGTQVQMHVKEALLNLGQSSPELIRFLEEISEDIVEAVAAGSVAQKEQCMNQLLLLGAIVEAKTSKIGWKIFSTILETAVGAARDGLILGLMRVK